MAKKTEHNRAQTLLAIIGVTVMCLIVVLGVYNSLSDQPDNNSEKDEIVNDETINYDGNSVGSDFTLVDSDSGLIFKFDSKTDSYIVIGAQDKSEINVVIPETYNSKPVSGIGDKAFANCKHITNITIPTSVTYIGSQAFYQCIHLTLIIYNGTESQWESINKDSSWNSSIGNVTINFGANTSTVVSTSVDSESGLIFELDSKGDNYIVVGTQNKTVVNVIIPEIHNGKPVTGIGDKAFAECTHITNITIPTSVTYIGTQAFYKCIHLTVIIYNGNESEWENIEKDKDSGIGNISIEYIKNGNESSTTAGSNSVSTDPDSGLIFELDSKGDTYIVIGTQNKTEVNVVIPETHNGKPVTGIGDKAFAECTHITNITIPTSITYIGSHAFYQCIHLTVIIYNGSETNWKSINVDKSVIGNIIVNFGVVDKCAKGHTEVIDKAVSATCTKSGLTQGKHCSVCGIVIVAQTTIKETGHTEVTDKAKAPTCTESGLTEGQHCSVCKAVLVKQTKINALGHTEIIIKGTAATCTTDGKTDGKQCSVCNTIITKQTVINALGHTVVTDKAVAATCTASGLSEGKHCSVCNVIITKQTVINALGHTEVTLSAVAPMCTQSGLTEGIQCAVCKITIQKQTVINALGHTEVTLSAVAPTCTQSGFTEGKACLTCQTIITKQNIINALGHTVVTDKAVAATCTASGLSEGKHCSVCNTVITKQTVINALGHIEVTLSAVAPTCTQSGLTEGKKCKQCNMELTKQEPIPMVDHLFVNAKCKICGKLIHYGLKFTSNGNGTCSVGLGTCEDVDIIIPSFSPEGDIVTNINNNNRIYINNNTTQSITIPNSITSIDAYAFSNCDALTKIIIPDNVITIGEGAFFHCSSLKSVIIGNGVTNIGRSAFSECTNLTSVSLGNSVARIEFGAFSECNSLTSINIPSSVVWIDWHAFPLNLRTIYIADIVSWCNILFEGTSIFSMQNHDGVDVYLNDILLTELIIPHSITTIKESCFQYFQRLTSVTIPNSVTSICAQAFKDCTGLTSITIPNSVTSIGSYAFYGCTSLTEVNFRGTVEQWRSISKGISWHEKAPFIVVHCTDGDVSLS